MRKRLGLGLAGLTATALLATVWSFPSSAGEQQEAGPAAATMDKAALGAWIDTDPESLTKFESWLGRPVDHVRAGLNGNNDWAELYRSVDALTGVTGRSTPEPADDGYARIDRPVIWDVPLIPRVGGDLVAAGQDATVAGEDKTYSDHWRYVAERLRDFRPGDREVVVRLGPELNGNWYPWSAVNKQITFATAYQNAVKAFRSTVKDRFDAAGVDDDKPADRFVFEWSLVAQNPAEGQRVAVDPTFAYPGNDYVDVIGMDFYWQSQYDKDPVEAWNKVVNATFGLDFHQRFAEEKGKPTAYADWGVTGNGTEFVANAAAWFASHPVKYQSYYDYSDGSTFGQWKLSDQTTEPDADGNGGSPRKLSADAYKTAFGTP